MNISLYDCDLFPLGKIIPSIVQKMDWKNVHTIIHVQNEEKVHEVDKLLWTFTPLMFIPHATLFDTKEMQDHSPILISHHEEVLSSFDQKKNANYIAINTLPLDIKSLLKNKEKNEAHLIFVLNSLSYSNENFDILKTSVIDSLQKTAFPFRWWVYENNSWTLKS